MLCGWYMFVIIVLSFLCTAIICVIGTRSPPQFPPVPVRDGSRREVKDGKRSWWVRPPGPLMLLVEAEHPRVVARPGGAVECWRRIQLDVECARCGMKGALDLALAGVAPHLCLDLQAAANRCPVSAIAAMLCGGAIARQLQLLHHDEMPRVRLRAARHRVDGGAVRLACAVRDDAQRVSLRDLQAPRVLPCLSAVHGSRTSLIGNATNNYLSPSVTYTPSPANDLHAI